MIGVFYIFMGVFLLVFGAWGLLNGVSVGLVLVMCGALSIVVGLQFLEWFG